MYIDTENKEKSYYFFTFLRHRSYLALAADDHLLLLGVPAVLAIESVQTLYLKELSTRSRSLSCQIIKRCFFSSLPLLFSSTSLLREDCARVQMFLRS